MVSPEGQRTDQEEVPASHLGAPGAATQVRYRQGPAPRAGASSKVAGRDLRSALSFNGRCGRISRDQRINEQIRAREVRLIDEKGEQLGIIPLAEALRIARERGLDLVEVASQAQPVVCRLMDYGRYKYEMAKREREARRHQKIQEIKEVKLRVNIDDHDFEVKARNAMRFLKDGDKVKATIMFRGREITHPELGLRVLERLTEYVQEVGQVEQPPRVEGRNMVMMLAPKAQKGSSGSRSKPAEAQGG
ncbi:MAG: translation initiation factor IF-3 [Clostridiales bacterium]|nr:translation initiation factor IF-3 [Clostridiales bacterium]